MQTQQLNSFSHKTTVARNVSLCTHCMTRSLCLHDHLKPHDLETLTSQYTHKLKMKKGDPIFHNGDPIHSLYTVRVGFVKVEYCLPNGQHQVNHFATNGDLIGADGIANGKHRLDAIALTDGELCSINFARIQTLMRENIALQKALECAMSRELNNTQEHLFSLGSHCVEQKLAFFLLHLHHKLGALHSSLRAVRLPMNRDELKSYLGVTTESLSRAFTNLEKKGYLKVRNKEISAIDFERLKKLLEMS